MKNDVLVSQDRIRGRLGDYVNKDIKIRAAYQHKGVGKRLIYAAEVWAVENKINVMRLNSGISRTMAHDFYRHATAGGTVS